MQTYESHIPYLLKFTTDFNISPMGWLHLSDMKFRPPLPSLSQHSQQSELLVANTPVQSSSHPFTSPLTTQFPFLSAMSPIRGKLQALSGSELQQPQVASNDVLSFFTQETVPKQFLWNEEETVNPEDEEDQEVIINGMKVRGKINPEILELLDGLNAEDIFTQRPALETVSDKVESKVAPTPWIREKDSTCEIELDGHCDAIVNAKIPRGEFGKELWEEEKLRCGRKNMQFDPLPVAPFTQSFHRDLYLVENDFAVRLKRLQRKGIALRKASQKIVHHTNQRFGDVLSQFLTAEEQTSKSNSHPLASASRSLRNPLIHTPESDRSTPEAMQIVKTVLQEDISDPDVNQWVEHNMQQALLQNQIDDTGLSEIYSAPDNIVEEYIKSQITQNPANQQVISPVNKDMKDTSSQLDDFEQEEAETTSESYMRQEMEAILSCTQGDNFYEVLQPSNRMKSGSTEKSDDYSFLLPSKKTESDVIELLEDEEDVRESEPLSTTQLVVEKDVLAKQADNNINLANVRTTSMKEESTQYEKLLPAVRRRSDPTYDRNSNRLTSVFKRMKRDHGRGGDDSHLEHSTALPSVIPTLVSTKSTSTVSISSIPISILSKAKSKTKKAVSFAQENIYIEDAPPVNFTPPSDNFNGDESDASSLKLTLQQSTLPEENSTTTMECIDLTEDASPEPKSKASSELTKSNNPYQSASECIVLVSPSTPSPQRQQSSSSPAHPSGSINDKYLEKEPYFGMGEDPSLFYCEYCGAKTLMPSFQAPKVSELSDLSNFGLLPAINPPASYSKLEDLPKIDINATNAYNQYMLSRHPIYYKNQVEVFDGGFPGTLNSITKLLFPRASTRFAMYSVTKSRKRCLIPNFRPPKPSFFKAIPTSTAEDDATSMQFLTPEHAQENKWAKSQIATPTQTQHTMHTSSTATTPSSHASETDANHDHMKSLKFGQGNQSFMNKMTRLLVLSMELFCITRKDLLPNPKYDSIQMICWIAKDTISNAEHEFANRLHGLICILPQAFLLKSKQQVMQKQAKDYSTSSTINSPSIDEETIIKLAKEKFSKLMRSSIMHRMDCFATPKDIHIDVVLSEKDLFQAFIDVVQGVDPDFLMGYESQSLSFGYFIKRGHHLGFPCLQLLSRLPKERPSFRNSIINPTFNPDGQPNEDMKSSKHIDGDLDGAEENIPVDRNETDDNHAIDNVSDVGIYIKGRTYLNIWQIMRSEVRLFNSSLQHVVEEVLKERIPSFSWSQLSRWYVQTNSRYKVVDVLFTSTVANILLLDKLDLIRKISESSRLYGIDFYSVLNRGSQYRVEAALLIRSNALEYLLISPSRTKVAQQSAMEAIPLVMEPQSGLYTDPVLVLDFQSLYPSMMIAYNLCFSTCLGKLKPNTQSSEDTTSKLGVVNYPETMTAINSTLHMSKKMSGTKDNKPFIAPNGSVFCSKEVRHGILPRMVKEMLQTRLMVKRSMKQHCAGKQSNSSKVLEKVSDARQLAIKLLCNVTCKL